MPKVVGRLTPSPQRAAGPVLVIAVVVTAGALVPALFAGTGGGGQPLSQPDDSDYATTAVAAESAGVQESSTDPSDATESLGLPLRWRDLTAGSFRPVALVTEGADPMTASNPADALLRDRAPGESVPSVADLERAAELLEGALSDQGLIGSVTIWPQWGLSYRGSAPSFSTWIDVEVWPSAEGTLELLAQRESFAYSLIEEDLPADSAVGSVWLSDHVAYGHNSGPDPDEWVAIDLGSQLFLVRIYHLGGSEQLLGRDGFIERAVEAVESFLSAGLSRSSIEEASAFRDHPELAEALSIALTTRCDSDCGPILSRR